jgi:hypothetical protein
MSSQGGVRGDNAYQSDVLGTLFGNFRDSGVSGAARTRPDVAEFVREYAREPVGNVRATVVALGHRIVTGLVVPVPIVTTGV